jgi:hypothetical protein
MYKLTLYYYSANLILIVCFIIKTKLPLQEFYVTLKIQIKLFKDFMLDKILILSINTGYKKVKLT